MAYRYREYTHRKTLHGANSMTEAIELWNKWKINPDTVPKPDGELILVRIDVFVSLDWFKDWKSMYLRDNHADTGGKALFIAMYTIHRYQDTPLIPDTEEEPELPLPELPAPFSSIFEP
jgi:hypothetical protein